MAWQWYLLDLDTLDIEDTMISEQTIQHAAQLLGEAAKPSKVILFGSYARGDAGENSDLDFLIVEPTLQDKFSEMVRLRQVLRPLNVPVDVLVCSQAEMNLQQHACSTAIYWALREGKVLYESTH
jgi:predicted nucleotidyltransferase